jgi:hypothetical protein
MRHSTFIFLIILLFVSCSDNEPEKPSLSKCTLSVSKESSFTLCSHFREPIDTLIVENKKMFNGIMEYYSDENLLVFNITGLNFKFNDILFDDLIIKIHDNELIWMEAINTKATIFFKSYDLTKNNENEYTLVINGIDYVQGVFFAYSDNKLSLQINSIFTLKIVQ